MEQVIIKHLVDKIKYFMPSRSYFAYLIIPNTLTIFLEECGFIMNEEN